MERPPPLALLSFFLSLPPFGWRRVFLLAWDSTFPSLPGVTGPLGRRSSTRTSFRGTVEPLEQRRNDDGTTALERRGGIATIWKRGRLFRNFQPSNENLGYCPQNERPHGNFPFFRNIRNYKIYNFGIANCIAGSACCCSSELALFTFFLAEPGRSQLTAVVALISIACGQSS